MNQLIIPNKLYGRERESLLLLGSFERVSNGVGEVLLVPGSSGVGKTALVHELQVPVRDRNGLFISGKFDQYQQNIPYSAFRQSLAELCRELQSGDKLQRSRIKTDIHRAIGNLGQVLVELVPELELFLGPQPSLEDISPQEARHRFVDVFRSFLKVICQPEHPLVLFLDDWQWADVASLQLLRQLDVGISLRYLLVIVSYRDGEIDSSHPLSFAVDDLRRHFIPIEVLQVTNISRDDVRAIIIDALVPHVEDVSGLANIVYGKTLGNPFFVRSFLSYLYEINLLWYNGASKRWYWRMDNTGETVLPDNVVELFVVKLRRLDSESQHLFSLAACLGNNFLLENLTIISGKDTRECMDLLFSDRAKGLFLPFHDGVGKSAPEDTHFPEGCSFLHDRLQQAAYSLIERASLPHILLKIGRLLLTKLHPEQLAERLFEVVNDLNSGYNLIEEMSERIKMVELNISAARKAYAATAYSSSLQYYRAASRCFEDPEFAGNLWSNYHEITMNLFKERAECEFLEGVPDDAEMCIQRAVDHAINPLEKADALNILIVQYTLQARYPEAVKAGRQALATLNITLPEDGYEEARNDEIALVRNQIKNRAVSSLFELPEMTNPEMLMASKILITMGPPCYRAHQRLWSVIVPKVVNLTLGYGNIPQVGYSHTAFGGLLGWLDYDYAAAKEFGELATRLMTSKFRSPSDQSVFYLMIGSSIRHWFKHLKYGSQDYADAYEIGLRSGNLQYAAYAFGHNMYCQFYQGVPLPDLIKTTMLSLEFSRTRLNRWAIDLLEGGLNIFGQLFDKQIDVNFNGHGDKPWVEDQYLLRLGDHHNIQVTCIYHVLKSFLLLFSGKNEEALELSDKAEPLIFTVGSQGLLPWPEHVFARLLILTSLYSKAEAVVQTKWRAELDVIMGKLRIWADNCPENFEHKYLLGAAELARIDGRVFEALSLYDRAIESAHDGNFLQWGGMANERAFGFCVEHGNGRMGQTYWQNAYVCYKQWGAVAKVCSMEADYLAYLAQKFSIVPGRGKANEKKQRTFRQAVIDTQKKRLSHYAEQWKQTRLHVEATSLAEELTSATQRLRLEISERKKTEELLRQSEEQYRSLFTDMLEGFAMHEMIYDDAGTPVDYRFLATNPAFEKMTGLKTENLIGKRVLEVMPQTEPYWIETYGQVALTGEPISFENYSVELDKYFRVMAFSNHPNQFVTVFDDITERKKTELALALNNERLREMSAEKDKLFSIIAHDLRSPFNSFLGLTQIMAEELPNLTMDKIQKMAVMMQKSATNLFRLLENLLHWSRMKQGQIPFSPEHHMLRPLVNESILMNNESAREKQIEITCDIPDSIKVYADNNMLQTVLRNLVSNAVKFTPKGGRISLSARNTHTGEVEIFVKDTGIGMKQSLVDVLFRLDGEANRKGTEGELSTGLGLIICKDFIEKHGGIIRVESEEGKGSVFYFTLPDGI